MNMLAILTSFCEKFKQISEQFCVDGGAKLDDEVSSAEYSKVVKLLHTASNCAGGKAVTECLNGNYYYSNIEKDAIKKSFKFLLI